ncbi:hypothetical protein BX666DRAFT_1963504 [Dichotomocladium elegans]|nr:hypothetical protein BX666DRAFT_1963504 [Dichotomocladium elegans]
MLFSHRLYLQRVQLLVRLRVRQSCARYYGTSRKRSWFERFLTPKEEQDLYLSLTSAFRSKLKKQSTQNAKSYGNIIEQVIFTSQPSNAISTAAAAAKGTAANPLTISLERLDAIKQKLDDPKCTDKTELERLWREMQDGHINSMGLYNRLIRALIRADALPSAVEVFRQLTLMPTTRTFTYLIDAHLKIGRLDKAEWYVDRMRYLNLNARTAFDCSILLRYYIQANERHAVDHLWHDVMQHKDTIKPGWLLYTLYIEWLLRQDNQKNAIAECVEYLHRIPTPPQTAHTLDVLAKASLALDSSHPAHADKLRRLIMEKQTQPHQQPH